MEIVDGLAKDGSLFVPSDEPLLEPLVEKVTQQVITFGFSQESQLQGIVTNEAKEQTSFKISDTQMTFTIQCQEPIMSPCINRNWYWSLFPING